MKANQVMRLLRISRATLHRYAEKGNIRYMKLPSGIYNYNDEDVYKLLNKDVLRKNYIYARVSTAKQKKDLENQIEMLKSWSFNAGIRLSGIYSDVASGISFDKRNDFFTLLDEVIDHRVETMKLYSKRQNNKKLEVEVRDESIGF